MPLNRPQIVLVELVDQLLRRWGVLVLAPFLGLSMGVVALEVLPSTYQARSAIYVAPSQIPDDFVRTERTGDMAMRLASLRESVLSRNNITELVHEFRDGELSDAHVEEIIREFRQRLHVSILNFDRQRGSGVFELVFKDSDPHRAARVVNDLTDKYIQENNAVRAGRANSTASVLRKLANDVRAELLAKERAIADFKAENLFSLESHFSANLQLLRARQQDLEANQRAISECEDRCAMLRAQRAVARAVMEHRGTSDEAAMPRRSAIEAEIEELRARYTNEHPTLKAKLDALRELEEKEIEEEQEEENSPDVDLLETQIAAAEREATRLKRKRSKILQEVEIYQDRIEKTPIVQRELAELTKGYDVLDEQYREYQRKIETARAVQVIEESQKGEQFEIIERAVAAAQPTFPKPLPTMGAAAVLATVLFLIPLVLKILLRPRVYSKRGVESNLELPVVAVLERVSTKESRRLSRRARALNLSALAAGALILGASVVFSLWS